ncbi:MAG: DUF748 domain-containing protein [Cyanothece sp. SIO1E1]|nr:DUF748 domain-containing protein [Cyanothece sp. SIO1E1]
MTTPSNSPPQEEPKPTIKRRFWPPLSGRTGLILGILTTAGFASGIWWTRAFVHDQLAPQVEQALTRSLKRPVQVGRLESFSLTQLKFGALQIPATATDPDTATVAAIEIKFNLFQVLLSHTLGLDIALIEASGYLEQDQDGRWVNVQITESEPNLIKVEVDQVRLQDSSLVLVPYPEPEATARPISFKQINGDATLRHDGEQIAFEVKGQPDTGGRFDIKGELLTPTQQANVAVRVQAFPVAEVSPLLNIPGVDLAAGLADGNIQVAFQPDQPLNLLGNVRFKGATLEIASVPHPLSNAQGQLRFQGQVIALENTIANYDKVQGRADGTIHLQDGYNLTGQVRSVDLVDLLDSLSVDLPVPVKGLAQADLRLQGALNRPIFSGQGRLLETAQIDRIDIKQATVDFTLAKLILSFDQIQAQLSAGGQLTGKGQLDLVEGVELALDFQGQDLPGDAIAQVYGVAPAINLGQIAIQGQVTGPFKNPQTEVQWQAPEADYPGRGEILVTKDQATLEDTVLQVAGGTVNLNASAGFANKTWAAVVSGSAIQLSQFSPQLRGLLSTDMNLEGTLDAFSPSNIRAAGQVEFSQGLASFSAPLVGLNQPLTATVQWDGAKVVIQEATAAGIQADGLIFAQLEGPNSPVITGVDLNVQVNDYNLATLPLGLSNGIALAGQVGFAGKITGQPTAPIVDGSLQLNRLAINDAAFEPVLAGQVQLTQTQGLNFNVAGQQDQITLVLDSAYEPEFLQIQLDQATAVGRSQGELFQVEVANFPLALLDVAPVDGLGPVKGLLKQADFELNLNQNTLAGEVEIDQPALGHITADQLAGQIRYANGIANLTEFELRRSDRRCRTETGCRPESRYLFAGSFTPGVDPQFEGTIDVAQGQVQDVLEAVQWFNLSDFARGLQAPVYTTAAEVEPIAIGLPNTSLLTQLRRFSEIEALLEQQVERRQQASFLPDLDQLEGNFTGAINVAGSFQSGLTADFDLRGQDWRWGDDYSAEQVIAIGDFKDGILTLLPLSFGEISSDQLPLVDSERILLTFSGQLGGMEQSGQLRAQNLPVEAVQALLDLPVDVRGKLGITATLAGSFDNPQVRGELKLLDGSINRSPVDSVQGTFSYLDARLTLGSNLVIEAADEPIQLRANIPYRLPFASVKPDNDQLLVQVKVRNEGLALLNLLNREVAWKSGQGELQLQIEGSLSQPIATGTARLEGATFEARVLPEPLTDVTGAVEFSNNQILISDLQGNFSQGQVKVTGALPLVPTFDTGETEALTVALEQIALRLKGLYVGGVEGELKVTGAALAPKVGGNVNLFKGRIALPGDTPAAAVGQTVGPIADIDADAVNQPLQFDNLQLLLGEKVRITRDPILNFVANGTLTINGTIDDIRPSGTIQLESGQVNLFTTRFTLARGFDHTAEFSPNRGLDPDLNILLRASASEVTRIPVSNNTPFPNSEIDIVPPSGTLGDLQTVRIQARVKGPSSQLFNNLELTSSPARSENEILSLLGGGFVETLGRGDSPLAIANLAGSALFGGIQDLIGSSFGLSEFRLFPATIALDDDTTALGLGAEAGIDITNKISISALTVLTADEPARVNLRYRINENFLFRVSTDFSEDSQGVLEYRLRF